MGEELPKEILDTIENMKGHIEKAFVELDSEQINSLLMICAKHSFRAGQIWGIENTLGR